VASHALYPVGESPFDYLLSDMTEMDLDRYRKAVKAAWPDLVSTKDTAQCRQILIDLVDWNLDQLNLNLAEHQASADAIAQKTVERLSAAKTPEGQRLAAYHVQCKRALDRGFETLRKYQGKKKAEGQERKDEYAGMMEKDEGRRTEEPGRRAEDGGWRIPDFARWIAGADASDHVPDRSFLGGNGERDSFEPSMDWVAMPDGEAQADCGTGTAGATESASASMTADTTVSDGVTLPDGTSLSASVTLADGITLLEGSELDAGTGDASGNSPDLSGADALADRGDEMGQRAENSENVTNEAKIDQDVIVIQNEEFVGVAADSGVESGLDRGPEGLEVSRGKGGVDQRHSRVRLAEGGRDDPAASPAVALKGPRQKGASAFDWHLLASLTGPTTPHHLAAANPVPQRRPNGSRETSEEFR